MPLPGHSWVAGLLVPVSNVQVTTRILYNLDSRTGRYQVEVTEAGTKELLAMRSRPFHEGLSARETCEEAHEWVYEAVNALVNPDPFP